MAKRTRKVKSIKNELLKKAREAMLAAVQIYNNPQVTFKSEIFTVLSIIAWTYLFHAYYKSKKIDYRYYKQGNKRKIYEKTKRGADKHWELERCLTDKNSPVDEATSANLKFLIGVRHEIEHQMTDKIDELLSAKFQACALNFDYYIMQLFGKKYNLSNQLALSIQFSPVSPEQQTMLKDNPHVTTNIKNFIAEFENEVDISVLSNQRYAYRVLYVPLNANRRGQADRVIEFVRADSELAQNINDQYLTLVKETEKPKFLPGDIIKAVKAKGYVKLDFHKHAQIWHELDAKNPKYHFGTQVIKQWYWYESWLDRVLQYCEEHKERFC